MDFSKDFSTSTNDELIETKPINPFIAFKEKFSSLGTNKSMFSSIRKDTSDEVLRNLNITKKKEELKNKNKLIQNKNKKDLQANSLSDIVDLDENFEFILKNDVT